MAVDIRITPDKRRRVGTVKPPYSPPVLKENGKPVKSGLGSTFGGPGTFGSITPSRISVGKKA